MTKTQEKARLELVKVKSVFLIIFLFLLAGGGWWFFRGREEKVLTPPSARPVLTPSPSIPSDGFRKLMSERIIVKRSELLTNIIFFLDYTGDLKEKSGDVWVLEEGEDQATFTIGEETRFYAYDENWEKLKIEKEEIKVGDRVAIMVRTVGFDVAEKISKGDLKGFTVTEVDLIKTKQR